MASQDVVVTYRAEVDQLTQELKKVIAAQEAITKEEKQGTQEVQKNVNAQQVVAKKRLELLKLEEKELAKLKQLRKLAFDPKTIQDYDDKISKANKNIALLAGKANKELGGLGSSVKSIGLGIAAGLGAAFSIDAIVQFGKASVQFGKASVQAFAKLESSRLVFKNLVGDAERAKELFSELQDFAIKSPFTQEEIEQGSKALLQFGVSANEVIEVTKMLGDVSAGTGKNLAELSIIYGQIKSTGRLMGQDLLQLINAGFNPLQQISEDTGVSMRKLKQEMEKGNISFEMVADAFKSATSEGGKFFKLTEQLGSTTAGQLSTMEDEVTKLSQALGEKLAPAFLKVKKAFIEGLSLLFDDIERFSKGDFSQLFVRDAKQIEASASTITTKIKEQEQSLIKLGITQKQASEDAVKAVRAELLANVEFAQSQAKKALLIKDIDPKLLDFYKQGLQFARDELALFTKYVNSRKTANPEIIEQENKLLKLSELQKINTEDLIKLSEEQATIEGEIAKKNIKNIEDVIKAREVAFEQYKKNLALLRALEIQNQPDQRIQLEAQFGVDVSQLTATGKLRTQIIEQLQIELNNKLKALDEQATEDEKKQYQDRETAFQQSLEDKKRAAQEFYNEAQKLLTDAFLQESAKLPEPERRQIAESFEAELRRDEAAEIKKIDDDLNADFEDKQNKKIIVSAETTAKIKQIWEALGFDLDAAYQSDLQKWLDKNEQILDSSVQLFNSLSQLYSTYAQNQVQQIQDKTNAEIEQLDRLSEYNQEQLDKRRISEREFANRQKKLEEEKIKIQEAADKKSREIKRKAAILDKAAALSQIIIDTAKNIASTTLPPLMALYAAVGAAQAAIVIAQPIPYKKGTKRAKGGLSQVDEEGTEAILRVREGRLTMLDQGDKVLPAHKTVTYGKVLDTMFDGTFDKHYMKKEMAPRLVKQRELHERSEKKSFARNISESLVINSQLNTDPIARQLGKGVNIANLDELYSIIDQNRVSPYRR